MTYCFALVCFNLNETFYGPPVPTKHFHRWRIAYKPLTNCSMLQEGGVRPNRLGIHKQKYKETRGGESRAGSGQPSKVTAAVVLSGR